MNSMRDIWNANESVCQYISIIILFAIYMSIFIFFIGNAEVTSDDGIWSSFALDILDKGNNKLYGEGRFYKISSLVSYIEAFFLMLNRSHYSILIGLNVLNLIAHYFIIRTGEILKNFLFGISCSLFFFFKPIFFNFYSQKTWQVSVFPLFLFIFFYSLLKFEKEKKCRWLYISFSAASLAYSAHLFAVFLLGPLIFIVIKNIKSVDVRNVVISLLLYHTFNFPILLQFQDWGYFFVAHVLLVLCFVGIKKNYKYFKNSEKIYEIWRISLLIFFVVILCVDFFVNKNFGVAWKAFFEFFPANNLYVASHNFLAYEIPFAHSYFSLELLLFFVFIIFAQKIVLWDLTLIILIELALLELTTKYNNYPHQWFIFSLPVLIFPVMDGINNLINNKKRWMFICLIMLILISNSYYSLNIADKIRKSGGWGNHMANLDTKVAVVKYIDGQGERYTFEHLNYDWYGDDSWTYLFRLYNKPLSLNKGSKETKYFFYEYRYRGKNRRIPIKVNGLALKKFRTHTLYFDKPKN